STACRAARRSEVQLRLPSQQPAVQVRLRRVLDDLRAVVRFEQGRAARGEAVVREQHDAGVGGALVYVDDEGAELLGAGGGVRYDLDRLQVCARLAGHVRRGDAADAEGHGRGRVGVDDAVDVGAGGEDAGVPAVLLRGLEVEVVELRAGEVHEDDVVGSRVRE